MHDWAKPGRTSLVASVKPKSGTTTSGSATESFRPLSSGPSDSQGAVAERVNIGESGAGVCLSRPQSTGARQLIGRVAGTSRPRSSGPREFGSNRPAANAISSNDNNSVIRTKNSGARWRHDSIENQNGCQSEVDKEEKEGKVIGGNVRNVAARIDKSGHRSSEGGLNYTSLVQLQGTGVISDQKEGTSRSKSATARRNKKKSKRHENSEEITNGNKDSKLVVKQKLKVADASASNETAAVLSPMVPVDAEASARLDDKEEFPDLSLSSGHSVVHSAPFFRYSDVLAGKYVSYFMLLSSCIVSIK